MLNLIMISTTYSYFISLILLSPKNYTFLRGRDQDQFFIITNSPVLSTLMEPSKYYQSATSLAA